MNTENELSQIYTEEFFDFAIHSERETALGFAEVLINHFKPGSVIDVGCGCGEYLKAFVDFGIKDVKGYDGSTAAIKKSLISEKIEIFDLRFPLLLNRRYDLCLCIEVAEHIENIYSGLLVQTLVGLSDTIFFTAATPNQGGHHHVNEQPHQFWINLFQKKGYIFDEELTHQIRMELEARNIIWWVTKNLMIFKCS